MRFFNKYPITRLIFFLIYLVAAVWFVVRDFAWLNIIIVPIMLFACYISIIKSGLKKDVKADGINNFSFDFLSLVIMIYLSIDIVFKLI